MTSAKGVAARALVGLVVAGVVVGLSGVAPLLAGPGGGGGIAPGPDHPEYSPDRLAPDRIDADGEAAPTGDVGTVLFDRSHRNRFEREDVASMVRAINEAGGETRFTEATADLEEELRDADVFVVVDPADPYDSEEVEAVEEFVDNGGRVVLVGEPNRQTISSTGFGATLQTQRAELDALASPFGITFGTQYVYDLEANDGNFKNVLVETPDGTDHPVAGGVDEVTMYTAAAVDINRGEVLLRTSPTAERADREGQNGYPVAVVDSTGSVLAIGDKTMFQSQYYTVADNDVFLERVVEFMTRADHEPPEPETPTPAPPPTAAA